MERECNTSGVEGVCSYFGFEYFTVGGPAIVERLVIKKKDLQNATISFIVSQISEKKTTPWTLVVITFALLLCGFCRRLEASE